MAAKAAPKSKPGKWDKPALEVSATKKGPGRKAPKSHNAKAPRVMVAPEPSKKLIANIGGPHPLYETRRVWRDREPVHIVKPVRAARLAAKRAEVPA